MRGLKKMKKVFIYLFLSAFVIFVGAVVMFFPNEITDRINPLVPKSDIYVQINEEGTPLTPGGYDYTLTGYNESGEKAEVTFYAPGELREDAYLRVYTKGKYVETWEEVQLEEMPEEVKEKF